MIKSLVEMINNFVGVFYFFSSTMGERDNDKLLEEIDKWIHQDILRNVYETDSVPFS